MTNMVSPNDLQQAAITAMLEGRAPETRKDWALCANYWAANIACGLETAALPVMGMLFDCPLTKEDLIEIAEFQAVRKGTIR